MALLLGLPAFEAAIACPAAVLIKEVDRLPVGLRQGLRLFALKRTGWEAVPFQLDPLTPDGRLLFDEGVDLMGQRLEASDILAFQIEDFGQAMGRASPPLPCRAAVVYELKGDDSYAYLTHCGDRPKVPLARQASRVTFDKEHHTLQSELYRYRFNPDNYMQFASIAFRTPGGAWGEVASDSRLLIHADIKNFFTMQFDSHQIESHLEASRLGSVGNLARLSFFLRILLFKIRMSLATDVGFFADSGHIPMQVDLPVNAYERLNPGSGILYSWRLSDAAGTGARTMHMPLLNPALIQKGFKELAKLGLTYCQSDSCLFSYSVNIHGQLLSMELDLKRELVARGFFPMFVADTRKPSEEMDWDLDDPEDARRIGMYFEVSGLPQGGHPWDFWLRLGTTDQGQRACPRPVALRLLK